MEFSPNLLPASLIEGRRQRRLRRVRAIGIIVAIVPIVLAYALILARTNQLEAQLQAVNQQLPAARADAAKVQELEASTAALRARDESFNSVQATVFPWAETLTSITTLIPQDVWFSSVQATPGAVTIDGNALTDTSVPTLAARLQAQPYLSNLALPYTREANGLTAGGRIFTFEFAASVVGKPTAPAQ